LSDASDPIDLPGQLEALSQRLAESNPELYRHVALYLQVLRQVLPQQVRQACFHLATQVHPQRYVELPAERRRQLLAQIDELVSRCSSLLTVEHLVILAGQMDRERQRRDRQERQELLQELTGDGDTSAGAPDQASLPPGSVQIGFSPPHSGASFLWGPLGPGSSPETDPSRDGEPDEEAFEDQGAEATGPEDHHDEDDPEDRFDGDDHLSLALPGPAEDGPGEAAEAGEAADTGTPQESLWQPGRLPGDPERVLQWMEGMDQALSRRLRNLSHAVNVELLRSGVSRSLLPVSLLDAVLAGQLDTLAAPSNLMRLPLPFGGNRARPGQTMAVLLRAVELELEEPRLRTCRRRLQQHRQEVRRMAQQYRRLQRRWRIHQAEQLWLQDIRPTPAPGD
jgi:hypothetical protein